MKCIIPGGNVKVLAKAIHMLAKIGDEIYVNPQKESISFRTVNMAKSAYSNFTFHNNFFSYYTLGDLEEEEAQKCKISMRSAMTIFKSAHTLDKQVETCHIHLEVDACNLVFILKYKNGVNKSHLSPILDSEKLQASYSKNGMTNELMSRARTLLDALHNFPQNLIEMTLEITPHKLLLRNYVDDASVMENTTRTQLALGIKEFDRYTVGNETIITFCLKEVRAFLAFSESIGVPINVNFETAGRPMLLASKNQSFEVNLLLSTLSPDSDSQSDSSVVSKQVQSIRRKNVSSRNISKSKCVNKSSKRARKTVAPAKPTINDTIENRPVKEKNKTDKILNQNGDCSSNIVSVETNFQNKSEQNRLFMLSPASTSSVTNKRIPENQQKLANSVFSSITKRKLTNDEDDRREEKRVAGEYGSEENVPHSPPRCQVTKRARLVFRKCLDKTFDPRTLPGHETILVEDSDENND